MTAVWHGEALLDRPPTLDPVLRRTAGPRLPRPTPADDLGPAPSAHTEVLGPLRVSVDGQDITPRAAKPRTVLALLACEAGETVAPETIIDELWTTTIPRSAAATVQTYVMHLRTRIADAFARAHHDPDDARRVLVTCGRGYQLVASCDGTDLRRFHELSNLGLRAAELGDDSLAVKCLRAALELWRDTPMVDVTRGPLLQAHVRRLEEWRLSLSVQTLSLELRLGRLHPGMLDELETLGRRYPLHETVSGLSMVALSATGHHDRARHVYDRLRTRLDDRLGLEPMRPVQRLHDELCARALSLDHLAVLLGPSQRHPGPSR